MSDTGQTSFADMFEYYCTRNVTNEREYNEREMLRWLKQQLQQAHRTAEESAKDAHRRGWEQAKKEAVEVANTLDKWGDWESDQPDFALIADAIAALEYKEPTNV